MQVTHDKKLLIAIGRSRKAAQWQNREMLWSEFLDKLANTTRTRETVNDYAAMTKTERDNVKDVGGFVGGYLKNGRRSSASVVNRCLICLDADSADAGLLDDLDMTFINAYALYSTHSHTAEKMRLRLIIPLSRTVTPDEYAAIARRVADDLTLSRFDPTTFEPARLMYWPSTPEDGEFVFRYADQPFLNPDEVLATYADWQDASLWPTTQPVEAKMRRTVSKQEDPLTKRGIIGAFCRAHSITDILENVLSDRYTSTTQDDRYTFVGGSTTGGLVVYDDKYAFSHHATDPAGGKLCNAFDLVRWHLFTPGGTASDGSRVGDENASIRRMQEYAAQDEATRRTLSEERREQAALEFGDLDALEAQSFQTQGAHWQEQLELDKQGKVKDTLGNLTLILRNDPRLKDIAYNIHRSGIDIHCDPEGKNTLPWKQLKPGWNESDFGALQIYLEHVYTLYTPSKLKTILLTIAGERQYHPIRDYIESLPAWDGVPRVDTLFVDYLGAADTAYTRAVARKMLVAAIARVYQPGIKFDSVVVLNGPQGMGKSSFFAKLGGKWFSDSLTIGDMKDKTAPEKLQGQWILELGELAGLKKVDVETVKAFITRQDDKFRHSYGYSVEDHPRQCIIVGSTNNEDGFLRDITGNRRFWPVTCSRESLYRGVEAFQNFMSSESKLFAILRRLDLSLLNGWGIQMLVLLSIVSVAALIKAKRENAHNDVQEIPFTVAILITIIGYLLLETKVAPSADIRYVMIVLPMITVFLLKWCWDVCRVLLSKATVTALIFIAVATICVCSYTEERVEYLFPQWVEEREAVEPYYQYDAIVVADEGWKAAGNMVLHLEEHGKSYIIKENQIDQLPELKLKTGAVIYVERDEQMDENRINLENTLHTDLTHLWTNAYMEIFFCSFDG